MFKKVQFSTQECVSCESSSIIRCINRASIRRIRTFATVTVFLSLIASSLLTTPVHGSFPPLMKQIRQLTSASRSSLFTGHGPHMLRWKDRCDRREQSVFACLSTPHYAKTAKPGFHGEMCDSGHGLESTHFRDTSSPCMTPKLTKSCVPLNSPSSLLSAFLLVSQYPEAMPKSTRKNESRFPDRPSPTGFTR